jgi:hypothetical protein
VSGDPEDQVTVSETDAFGDRGWFMDRPLRRYRVRRDSTGRWWVIRRRPHLCLLRTRSTADLNAIPDRDNAIRQVWTLTAWPQLTAAERAIIIQEIEKIEPRR